MDNKAPKGLKEYADYLISSLKISGGLISKTKSKSELLAEEFRKVFNQYLQWLNENPEKLELNVQDQEDVISFLELSKPDKTLVEWYEYFCFHKENEYHLVCVWIIQKGLFGFMADIISVGTNAAGNLLNQTVEYFTTEQHQRMNSYFELEKTEPQTIRFWIDKANSEERLVANCIIETIVERMFLEIDYPDAMKDYRSLRKAFWKEYQEKKR